EHGSMNLADRRSRERLLVELEEGLLEREPELLLNHVANLRERERPDVVLEPPQLGDDVGRHHVGAGREQLPELDEGGAELIEQLAPAAAAPRRGPVL